MMYVAIPVRNPGMPLLAFVRLALPLTDVDRQLAAVRSLGVLAFVVGTLLAVILTWIFSAPLARRLRAIDERARALRDRALLARRARLRRRTRSATWRACSIRSPTTSPGACRDSKPIARAWRRSCRA